MRRGRTGATWRVVRQGRAAPRPPSGTRACAREHRSRAEPAQAELATAPRANRLLPHRGRRPARQRARAAERGFGAHWTTQGSAPIARQLRTWHPRWHRARRAAATCCKPPRSAPTPQPMPRGSPRLRRGASRGATLPSAPPSLRWMWMEAPGAPGARRGLPATPRHRRRRSRARERGRAMLGLPSGPRPRQTPVPAGGNAASGPSAVAVAVALSATSRRRRPRCPRRAHPAGTA
mmetsp:Transcript_24961/g.80089  ORF Transcript_24961/g.80089 Transcript_24961/m.80089 type:complete len:235 (-) Transcript_24961:27-731(-)